VFVACNPVHWHVGPELQTPATGPGLGVELDWDWIDNNTQRVVRTPPA
jgi:hypothetical protein